MKHLLISLCLMLAFAATASAQSMTDDQIIEFAKSEKQAGTSNSQIVAKLMQRGVTTQRLQQLRRRLEREHGGAAIGQTSTVAQAQDKDRLRDANGEGRAVRSGGFKDEAHGAEEIEFVLEGISTESIAEKLDFEHTNVFGHDIFNNDKLSFEPNLNIATPDNYRLGTGDAVFIDIYGASQKTIDGTISPDGTVTIPGYGPVHLSGLTVAQANARLRSEVGQQYSSSRIQLTVGQTKTIIVNVMGEVKAPGTYTLSAFASVFHAMYMAGGPNSIGTLRAIKVYRKGKLISTVDVYDYILNGKLTGNVMLADDDVIVVDPYACLVDVSGKVKRPMLYEMKSSETVADLIAYAGGFTGDAYTGQVQLLRKTGKEYSIHSVGEFEMGAFTLRDQDQVRIDAVLERFSNMIEVKGAVFRPGQYQLGGTITSVKSLIEAASGLREEAYADHAVMHRRRADRTLEAMTVNVRGIINGTTADIPLQKDDVIFIPTRSDMMTERTVTITGEVYDPGQYTYAEGETVEDLIQQAGGLTERASLARVDVARRTIDRHATRGDSVRVKTFTFSMRDGFVLDGTPGFKLEPYDQVMVRRSPSSKFQRMISIEGEVQFEGSYAIDRMEMRLSDLLNAAGGVTREAYLKGARLERKITAEERVRMQVVLDQAMKEAEQRDNEERLMSDGKSGNADELSHAQQLKQYTIGDTYYVGIRLDEAVKNPGCDADIVLREGDRLVVPEYVGTVTINGEVMQKNTVAYEKGKKVKHYINQAGGYSLNAKKNRAYIVYMNGTLSRAKGAKVEPGCEIVVPAKAMTRRSATEYMAYATSATSLATMIATIANLITK